MKILSIVAFLLASELASARTGTIRPILGISSDPDAQGRQVGKVTTSFDVSAHDELDVQGIPGQRPALLKRKSVAGQDVNREWYGTAEDGSVVGNFRPCLVGNGSVCGSVADHTGLMVYAYGNDEFGDATVRASPYSAYPPELAVSPIEPDSVDIDNPRRILRAADRQLREKLDFKSAVTDPVDSRNLRSRRLQFNVVIDVMVVWTRKAECRAASASVGCAQTEVTTNNMLDLINLAGERHLNIFEFVIPFFAILCHSFVFQWHRVALMACFIIGVAYFCSPCNQILM